VLKKVLAYMMLLLLFVQNGYCACLVGATTVQQIEWQLEQKHSCTYIFDATNILIRQINDFEFFINGNLYDVKSLACCNNKIILQGHKDDSQTSLQNAMSKQNELQHKNSLFKEIKQSCYCNLYEISLPQKTFLTGNVDRQEFLCEPLRNFKYKTIRPPRASCKNLYAHNEE
jgi:hypothetical protein